MWWRGAPTPPHQPFLNGKTSQGKLCIILKGIYGRFRIRLNNCEFTKFCDFASDFTSHVQVKLAKFCDFASEFATRNRVRVKLAKISKFFF